MVKNLSKIKIYQLAGTLLLSDNFIHTLNIKVINKI